MYFTWCYFSKWIRGFFRWISFHGKRRKLGEIWKSSIIAEVVEEFAIAEEKYELSGLNYSLVCLFVELFGRCREFLLPYTLFRFLFLFRLSFLQAIFCLPPLHAAARFMPLNAAARLFTSLHASSRCTPRHASRRWNPWPTGHRHFIVSKLRRCPRQRIVSSECPLFFFRPGWPLIHNFFEVLNFY